MSINSRVVTIDWVPEKIKKPMDASSVLLQLSNGCVCVGWYYTAMHEWYLTSTDMEETPVQPDQHVKYWARIPKNFIV